MIEVINDNTDLSQAIARLGKIEPRFLTLYERNGLPDLRRQPAGFETLLFIITEQMISLSAAAAIWQRFAASLAPLEPQHLAAMEVEDLLSGGQSRAKARTIKAVAQAITSGELDLDEVALLDDETARQKLMMIKGIGAWTADIYLLSCLGRANVWPVGDVALQSAVGDVFDLTPRPDKKQMLELGQSWQPWRAVAARLLWQHYRNMRNTASK